MSWFERLLSTLEQGVFSLLTTVILLYGAAGAVYLLQVIGSHFTVFIAPDFGRALLIAFGLVFLSAFVGLWVNSKGISSGK
ncbi:hypothetical protein [Piscirickettsia litoralis]|uniref:Uncharacterized protein n=1 Tax=Piscirickettsia litoralis TaxID=1891921 RepID=A0ABX2ZY51_9GAMM|nr:hypothetical protein [Piscirickettsia litoralis]ODN41507.1 hypothetical protein BGC07_15475 [Piscirickettsia litoralis]